MSHDEALLDVPSVSARELEEHLTMWSAQTGVRTGVWALPKEPLPGHVGRVACGTIDDGLREMELQPGVRALSLALTMSPSGLRRRSATTAAADGPTRSARGCAAGRPSSRAWAVS